MSGETNLTKLLKNMNPQLNGGDYIFYTTKIEIDLGTYDALMTFKEEEGITYILSKETADSLKLKYDGLYNYITLKVHSSLEAVGLTAAVSNKLKEHNISANVVAAFYHDHIFVSRNDAENAVKALKELTV